MLHLGSIFGVKIVDVGEDWAVVRQVPFVKFDYHTLIFTGGKVKISVGERKTVGDYSVTLLDVDGNKAKLRLTYVFHDWEQRMLIYVQSSYGHITVQDMMEWSRLHEEDLEGLRPMCEDTYPYEASMIYKIPKEDFSWLSSGWFAANHACSSIFVPVHIANNDIYEPYMTGEAAELSMDLLTMYDHGTLSHSFSKVESVFLNETQWLEHIAKNHSKDGKDVSEFFTIVDLHMQKQAYLTEQMWLEAGKITNQHDRDHVMRMLDDLWSCNYSISIDNMNLVILDLKNITGSHFFTNTIKSMIMSMCESRLEAVRSLGINVSTLEEEFLECDNIIRNSSSDFSRLTEFIKLSNNLLIGNQGPINNNKEEQGEKTEIPFVLLFSLSIVFILIFVFLRRKYR